MIVTRGRFATYGEFWYDEVPPARPGVDIVVHRQRSLPVEHAGPLQQTPSMLYATDLTREEAAIQADFDTTCRYHIRRAGKGDNLVLETITEPENRLAEFSAFYDAFAKEKAIWLADPGWLLAASRAGQLALSVATREGEPLVWHATVISGTTAGLQYSCSKFRSGDNEYRARVARANRWLHWQDMLQLRARGLTRYDWGGFFADESTAESAGINNFKRSFGPTTIPTFDCTIPVTLRGRMWLALRDAWRSRRPAHPAARRLQETAAHAGTLAQPVAAAGGVTDEQLV